MNDAALRELFWSKVKKTDGCWKWKGTINQSSYATLVIGSRRNKTYKEYVAHRLSMHFNKGFDLTKRSKIKRRDLKSNEEI